MSRPTARPARAVAAARVDRRAERRRRLLLVLAAAVGSLAWVAAAGAQSVSPVRAPSDAGMRALLTTSPTTALSTSASPVVAPVAAVAATESTVLAAAPVGPVLPQGEVRYYPRTDASTTLDDKRFKAENPGLRRHLALIGVGVAAMIIGSEVDDGAGTVLVLGGAGLSLYGFYLILR